MSSDQHISNRLISAVSAGHLETARELINSFGLSYSKAWSDGYALLLDAAMMNRTTVAELLLTSGSPVNSNHCKPADTPLHFAALHGNIDIVKMLLNKGANINAKNQYGKTPLLNVIDIVDNGCKQDKLEVIELLLKHKADVNASDNDGTSPLHIAVRRRCLKTIEFLLQYEVNVNCVMYAAKWNKNYAPLHYAVEYDLKEVTTLLLSKGANVDIKGRDDITPFHIAVEKGYTRIAEELLNHGACINSLTLEGFTPLHIASEQGCEEIVKLLLNKGADVNANTKHNNLTPVHIAAEKGYAHIAEELLSHGACINSLTFKEGFTPLHIASEHGCEEIVKLLLNKGADVNANAKDNTPLHIAAEKGYAHIAEELLSHGACINSLTLEEGFTPLHIACEQGCEQIVKLLLNKGADVNASTKSNLTPLHVAIKEQDIAILNLLLQHGAKIDYNDKYGQITLQLAAEEGCLMIIENILKYCSNINNQCNTSSVKIAVYDNTKEIVKSLLEYGLNDDPEDTNNAALLLTGVKKGYLKIVEGLLKNGTDVNTFVQNSGDGFTPLHSAAKYKREEIAKLLISYEADINAQDKSGKTPIFYAIENANLIMTKLLLTNKANVKDNPELLNNAVKKECIKIIELLLQHDVDVNASDTDGRTALYCTSFRSSANFPTLQDPDIKGEIAELLLSKGANVNARTKCGETTLNAAIKKGYTKVVEALLKYNVNINSEVKTDDIPLHLTADTGNIEIIKMLLNKGADVNAKQKYGMTALHIASLNGHQEVIKILLKYGANINAQDYYDRTPLHLASKCGYYNIVEDLLQCGSDINILSRSVNKKNLTPFDLAIDAMSNYYGYNYFEDDPSEEFESLNEVCNILSCHVIKMKAANLYVNEKNLQSLKNLDFVDTIYTQGKCEKEIAKMKSEKINNANISFYDILAKDINSLTKFMGNENIVQVLKSNDYKSKFPEYASMIKSYFRKAMKRKELLDQVNKIIYFLFNNLPELPDDCTDKILSYLSDEDLRIIMNACNKPLSISNPNA